MQLVPVDCHRYKLLRASAINGDWPRWLKARRGSPDHETCTES